MGNRVVVRAASAVRGVTLVACAALLWTAAASSASGVGPFARNVISNPGADDGPGATSTSGIVALPGWVVFGNFTAVQYGTAGMPSATTPGPINRGPNFFAGGPSNSISSATQNIDLSIASGALDTGHVTYSFSGWLGGNLAQDDSMILSLTFNDLNGESLATVTLNGPTSTARGGVTVFLLRARTGTVPAGTRSVNVALISSRTIAPYNDGYADNISLVLTNPCVADFTLDGGVGIEDLLAYLTAYDGGSSDADVDDGSGTGTMDGGVGIEDLLYYLFRYDLGC